MATFILELQDPFSFGDVISSFGQARYEDGCLEWGVAFRQTSKCMGEFDQLRFSRATMYQNQVIIGVL